jgi:penicillin-insensitive murein endopeptidase
MQAAVFVAGLLAFGLGSGSALGQNTTFEVGRRAAALAALPSDAAQVLFGSEARPIAGSPEAIGTYNRGCLQGGIALPAEGPGWVAMRPSRNRAWGHPVLIALLERLAQKLPAETGWPGLLVGDIAQPRGGPMLTGHGSHQIGLDADVWLTPMPSQPLGLAAREAASATDVVAADGEDVDPRAWTPQHRALLEAFAHEPRVARIFVNPAIKRALCREAGADRTWLTKIRPWWGHREHFHIRLACPSGRRECRNQAPPPPGDGCGRDLEWWFSPEARRPPPGPSRPLRLTDLPHACAALVVLP